LLNYCPCEIEQADIFSRHMIKNVTISKVGLKRSACVPQLLRPLIAAAETGASLEPLLTTIVPA